MTTTKDIIPQILAEAEIVVVAPVCFDEDDDGERDWYFQIAVGGSDGGGDFDIAKIHVPEDEWQEARNEVIGELIAYVGGSEIVVHIAEDILVAAKLCERFWPSEETTAMRERVERELAEYDGRKVN